MASWRRLLCHRGLLGDVYNCMYVNRSVTMFLVMLYVITFCIVLPGMCSNWPYSAFYSPLWTSGEMKNRVIELHNRRLMQADSYLKQLDPAATYARFDALRQQARVDLAIGILSVRRQHNHMRVDYLTQVLTRVMQLVDADPGSQVLFICDTHSGPGEHDEVTKLGKYVPFYRRFPRANATYTIMDRFEKEKQDYVYCVERALAFRPRYVLILEDDALPREDFLPVLRYMLEYRIQRRPRDEHVVGDVIHHWAYVKLFYPPRWQGYGFNWHHLAELAGIGLFGGITSLGALLHLNRRRFRTLTRLVFFIATAVFSVLCALTLGRQHILELRRIAGSAYRLAPAPHCCSPANVYPFDKALQLIHYIPQLTCSSNFPLDAALDKFAVVNNYLTHLIEPSLVKHIGMISSLKTASTHYEEFIF